MWGEDMVTSATLAEQAFEVNGLVPISRIGREAIRGSEDLDQLLELKSKLSDATRGRGLWVFAFVLLALSAANIAVTISREDGEPIPGVFFLFIAVALGVLITAIAMAVVVVDRSRKAEPWLAEVDYRLAQLAARG
jgi:hypothetical protein